MDRRAIAVSGIVQGVGFRPFVYGLATRLGLHGFVKNSDRRRPDRGRGGAALAGPVPRRADGPAAAAGPDRRAALVAPTAARRSRVPDRAERGRRGRPDLHLARRGHLRRLPAPSCSIPRDRRYRYPFLNCTNCGPRLTIITGSPYDRERTTMASFAMCAACRAEYDDPADRRFHAQPIACPACGPRLQAPRRRRAADRDRRPAGRSPSRPCGGEDRRAEGPGRLSPGLRRRRRARPWPSCGGASTATRSRSPSWSRDLAAAGELCEVDAGRARRCSRRRAGPIVLLRRRPGGARRRGGRAAESRASA